MQVASGALRPDELERTVEEQIEVVRKGRVAAFPITSSGDPGTGIAAELVDGAERLVRTEVVCRAINAAIVQEHAQAPSVILLLRPGTLPVTESGAPRRERCEAAWQSGSLDVLAIYRQGSLEQTGGRAPHNGARAADSSAELSATERQVRALFGEVLNSAFKGPAGDETFFALGGNSLLAAQLLSRAGELFQIDIPPAVLYDAPTPRAFAAAIDRLRREEATPPRQAPIERAPSGTPAELSSGERRLWFLWRLEPESAAYNVAGSASLSGELSPELVSRAFEALCARHEALRTTYRERDGVCERVIGESAGLAIRAIDLTGYGSQAEERARVLAEEEALRPFDLERGPLLRVVLFRLGPLEHRLVVCMHHIVSDAWSMSVLIQEFATIHAALASERPALPELRIRYSDYASWQRRTLATPEAERQLAHWKERLGDEHAVLPLPTDWPRPAAQSFRGARVEFELDVALTARMKELARARSVTPFVVLLGAWSALLSRYSGQGRVRVGVPFANRSRVDLERVIGFFVNTQVLQIDVSADLPFEALLDQVRASWVEAQAHRDLPFDVLVEALNPERSLSHNPLFQVLYNHLVETGPELEGAGGLRVHTLERIQPATQVDLALDTVELGDRVRATLTYSVDLFERGRVERVARHFLALLAAGVAHPEQHVGRLELLDEHELAELAAWNETQREYGEGRLVTELIDARAAAAPETLALVYDGEELHYRELVEKAERWAIELCERGVGPDVLVGVCAERSIELVVALLAVLKAGGAYLPLEPDYPAERLAYLIHEARPRVLLTQTRLMSRLPESGVPVLCLDADVPASRSSAATRKARRAAHASNLAYCIYTSGSTGTPKGVNNTHAGLRNRLLWMQERYELGASDRVLQKTPFSFDVSVWEFFWPLMVGATLVVAPPGAHKDPAELQAVIERHGVTVLHFVPSMLQAFVSSGALDHCRSLQRVICSGEALPRELVLEFLDRHPAQLSNLYGPTEASIDVTAWECVREPERESVPIGRPIANTAIHILNAALSPVPVGTAGELYIGGVGLARGYVARPDLTAERFVPSPFHCGERLYRTGDRARYRADGTIEYLGRLDHQVKIRGQRVELGEIEARLLRHADVREAVVLAREDQPGQKRLVAYVVPNRNANEPRDREADRSFHERLRTTLLAELPEYMVPSQYVLMDALPLTKNGKLDRNALPAPELELLRPAYAPPGTELELALASIWCEVLGVPDVGLNDNFFELGGDSIVALQVVGKARSQGITVAPKDLFRHQTLERLARAAQRATPGTLPEETLAGSVELTPIQRWWAELGVVSPQHWNQALLLELREPLPFERLERAVAALIEHHDALRLRFREEAGVWRQTYTDVPAPEVCWRVDVGAERALEEAVTRVANAAQRSLDLERGPLLRAVQMDLGPGESARLLLVIHHLVVDGVSWRILLEDLRTALSQLAAGQPVRLPQKTCSFRRWSRALADYATTDTLRAELEYWRGVVEPERGHPGDTAAPRAPSIPREVVRVELDPQRTESLLTAARRAYRADVLDLLLTALSYALSKQGRAETPLIELEGHGREDLPAELDVSRTVGWFTTRYPVRLPRPASDRGAALKALKETLRALPKRGLGYGVLRYLSPHKEELEHGERPSLTFNYLGRIDASFDGDGPFRLAEESVGDARSAERNPGPLEIDALVRAGRLALDWQFDPRAYAAEAVRELARAHLDELEQLIRHCLDEKNAGSTPSDFPLSGLNQAELDGLPLDPRNIEDIFPLSPLQQGLLLHSLLEPESGIYLMQDQYRFESALVPEAFVAAWERVIERHPMLRACFVWQFEGKMLQVVQRSLRGAVEYLDLEPLSPDAQEQAIEQLLASELRQGFALDRGPLVHMRLIRLGERRYHFIQSYHHTLIDAWCRSLLLVEFFAHYRAALAGGHAELPSPPLYRDFIVWLSRRDLAATREYWREQLAGFEAATPLGIDRPSDGRPVVRDVFAELTEAQTRELVRVAQARKLTVNTFTQGAWAALLSQYSGSLDVVFGTTVAGRPAELPEVQQTVGLFINTIPLRVKLPPSAGGMRSQTRAPRTSVASWLGELLAQNVAMREHEHLPLVEIQSASEVPRGQPLFHTLFVFENAPLDASLVERRAEFQVEFSNARTHTNYAITVVVVPGPRLKLQLSYDAARFEQRDIHRLLEHFQRLLVAMVLAPDAGVLELPTLAPGEARRFEEWNRTERDQPFEQSYIGLFEEQAARHPERVAAACRGESATFSELDARASQLGAALIEAGVRAGDVVGVLIERGLGLLASVLGIFKAGAAYLPLDAKAPAARNAHLLGPGGIRALLVDEPQRSALDAVLSLLVPEARPTVLSLPSALEPGRPTALPGRRVPPDALAYVIFTSGSTGVPKGAMVTSRGMLNNQLSKLPYLGLDERDVIAQTASPSFDVSVWQLLAGLLCGARVEIVPDEIAHDPVALLQHVERTGITILESVPSLIQAMLAHPPSTLSRLRFLLPTGEALPPPLANAWFDRYPHIPLINAYGPAECADDVALHRIDEPLPSDTVYVPIGRPTDNTRLFVLDRLLRQVAVGVEGELYVAGAGVGAGYFQDPARTAEVFLPNPFAEHAGERLYRTGDRARRRADGALEYTGRSDQQVKIRGVRIELGDIEARLRSHPEVREGLVVVREDEPGKRRLVAYVVPAEALGANDAPQSELRQRLLASLRAELPESMVPLAYVFLERFPLSPNGKIDRRALPAPGAPQGEGDRAEPVTATERATALIWRAILAVPRVGRSDDFFELGGHSLLATQVASRVRHHFHVELPLRVLFEASRLSEFAARIDRILDGAGRSRAAPIPRADRTQRIPLSFAQQRLWFLSQMEPESRVHNLTEAARWRGRFDREAVRRAFDRVVQRHEVLRTRFREESGEPYQVVEPAEDLQIPVVEARDRAAAERDELALALAEREASVPFDLGRDPLLRVKIVEFAPDDHLVLVTAHHIVSDGWSMHLMVDEFAELYAAFSEDRAPRLPELTVQYADYAVWQRQWLDSGELDRQLAYWRTALGAEHPVLDLPGDRPRPAVQSQRGETHRFEIDAALTRSLRDLARRNDVTLFTLCLSALQVLLWRYSRQTDVRVGVPVASRSQLEIESLIGFFVNTHVFRGDLAGDPTFDTLLARVKEVTLGAQMNQDLPFERLVEALGPERSLGHNPLFQVLYNHVRPEHRALEALPGVEITWLSRRVYATEVDLTINAVETGEAISVAMIYATDLFERETIEQFARHFRKLLASVVENPRQRIGQLPLVDAAERRALLDTCNATAFDYPEGRCLHELIADQASRTPDRIAVTFGDEELRYAELEARATHLADRLRALGVGADVRVGIYLERSPRMLVSLLAVLKAGAAYVPLDPEYPAERIAYMLEDAAPAVVLTETHVAARLPTTNARVWCLDRDMAERAPRVETTPSRRARPDDLAYCIYTSGSTGRPKGVAISHRALVNCLYSMLDRPGLGEHDRMLALTSLSFDIAALELYLPLLCGARVVLVERATASDAEALLSHIERQGVTTIQATPSTWRMLTEARGFERLSITKILCGGEALPPDLARRLLEAANATEPSRQTQVWNVYGPTETTIWSARYELGPDGEPWLGHPLANTQIHVLDDALNPVPAGVVGELYIGGHGLARGYWNRPDLTAERFLPDPYSESGARLYRTGDLGRRRRDGILEYRGRADQQVKLRGHRIELGEIEARLRQHAGVRHAAVIVREDVASDPRLVAYVVPEDVRLISANGEEQTAYRDALHTHLRGALPEYMLPNAYVLLGELPLTSNRKLDRKALPAPRGSERARQYVAPRSPVERTIAGIWQEVLRVERVGVHDDFFELGGHSLLATQVLARVRQRLEVELGLRVLFEAHDLAGFAARVARALGATHGPPSAPLVPAERGERMPLSSAQERLWFLWRLEPESAAYNVPLALRLSGTLDRRALERAFEAVIERHEALRTEFRDEDGSPYAVIRDPGRLRISTSDLRAEPEPERSARLRALMDEEAAAPFDLADGEVLRVRVFDLEPSEHVLQLTMHHIVSDGWSMNVLAEELAEAYSAAAEGRKPDFAPLAIQFADYALWQRAWLATGEVERQLAYWKAELGTEHPVLALPTDRARPAVQSFQGATRSFVVPLALTRSLRELARRHDATLFMVLLAAFKLLLHRYSGQAEIRVGVPHANRARTELERVVGVFVNLHVLRTEVVASASFGELIEAVKQAALGAQAHPDLPFEELVQALNPTRSLSHSPLIQVMYNHLTPGAASFRKELTQLRIEELEPATRTTQFDLTLTTLEEGERLRAGLTYSTDLFDETTIDRIARHFTNLLGAAVGSPQTCCGALPLLDAVERHAVLETWNATRTDYPANTSVPELFEDQVRRAPHAVALTFGDTEMRYDQLNAAANRLAWALRRRGVGPDVLVGVLLDRSPRMLTALLGILKAGGAYLPLDPEYPAERLAYMLRDARPALILTDERLAVRLPEGIAPAWCLDGSDAELEHESAENPAHVGHPEHLAYCLYTSGSTGVPKAVAIPRRALVNFLCTMRQRPGLAPTDRVLALTSLSFDIAGLELYLPLIAGARVVLVDRTTAADAAALLAHIDEHGVTAVQATPATWRMLSQHPRFEREHAFRVLCGGEALEPELALRLLAHAPEVWNLYGPTETTVWSTLARILGAEGPPSIGRPVANTAIYILDAQLSPAPVGVPGELYIAGAGLARGYLGRPELTAERFVPSPFHTDGARLYRSGDRARYRADGAIECLGRADGQLKIRGYRVELGEIEARLRTHAGVREAAVIARRDSASELQLVAFIAPDSTILPAADAQEQMTARRSVRTHLAAALPEYMIPNRYRFLNALPLTAGGKIDRKALAAESPGEIESPHAPPRTELERRLAAIWQSVLGVERVGLGDDFFDLGGHSLLATQVISRIQKELRVTLPLRRLLEATTLERLAIEVARAEPTRPSAEQLQRLDALMTELEESQWT